MVVLPAPVWPTMATVSPGLDGEVDVAENPVGARRVLLFGAAGVVHPDVSISIGKPNVIEVDATGAFRLLRHCRRSDLYWRIEQFEDALARSHRGLQDVVFLAEVLNRTEKALCVLNEGGQDPDAGGMADDVVASIPDHAGNGSRRQHFDHRVINCVCHDRVFERVHVSLVDFGEFVVGTLLAVEQLQHHHAAHVFLQICIDARDGHANAAVGVTNLVAKDLGGVNDQRHDRECDQRQLGVHLQHDGDDSGENEDIFKDRDYAGGEHFVQGVDIGSDARDQASYGVFIVKADVQPLQMAEDLAAKVEHDFLAGPLHEVGLQVFEQETEEHESDVEGGDLRDADQCVAAEETVERGVQAFDRSKVAIDDEAGQVRAEDVGANFQEDGGQGNRRLPLVGLQIPKQPLHKAAVVGFSEYFLFLVGGHSSAKRLP